MLEIFFYFISEIRIVYICLPPSPPASSVFEHGKNKQTFHLPFFTSLSLQNPRHRLWYIWNEEKKIFETFPLFRTNLLRISPCAWLQRERMVGVESTNKFIIVLSNSNFSWYSLHSLPTKIHEQEKKQQHKMTLEDFKDLKRKTFRQFRILIRN